MGSLLAKITFLLCLFQPLEWIQNIFQVWPCPSKQKPFSKKSCLDPIKFDPNRFLDENGGLKRNKNMLGPFGVGKRSCPGQGIAELQVLLYTVNLLRYVSNLKKRKKKLIFEALQYKYRPRTSTFDSKNWRRMVEFILEKTNTCSSRCIHGCQES